RGRPVEELLRRRVGRARGDRDKQVEAALLAIEDRPRSIDGVVDSLVRNPRRLAPAVARADDSGRDKPNEHDRQHDRDRPIPAESFRGAPWTCGAKHHRKWVLAIKPRAEINRALRLISI